MKQELKLPVYILLEVWYNSYVMENCTDVIFIGMQPSKARFRKNCALDRFSIWMEKLGINCVTFQNAITDEDLPQKVTSADFQMLYRCIQGYSKVVALGALSSQILKSMGVPHFRMPHPSPRNRLLNDKAYEEMMLIELRSYINGEPSDSGSWSSYEAASTFDKYFKGNGAGQWQTLP